MESFFDWLQSLVTWLRRKTTDDRPGYVIKFVGDDGRTTLIQLSQASSQFPGVVSIWQLINLDAEREYIVILCNLAQIRESLASKQRIAPDSLQEFQRIFEVKAKLEIKRQRHILGSHLFLIGSITKLPTKSRFVDNKIRYFRCLDFVDCQLVNLQRNEWQVRELGANDDADKIVRSLMIRALRIEASPFNTWEELFWGVPWLKWLDFFAKARLGDGHVLQPPKSVGKR